jgi:hypothetical protein
VSVGEARGCGFATLAIDGYRALSTRSLNVTETQRILSHDMRPKMAYEIHEQFVVNDLIPLSDESLVA